MGAAAPAFNLEPFEDLLLKRIRLDVEWRDNAVIVIIRGGGGTGKAVAIERLEMCVGPR